MNQEEFKKILAFAIEGEDEAYAFYNSVSERVKDRNLKKLFSDLAEDEKKHKTTLGISDPSPGELALFSIAGL